MGCKDIVIRKFEFVAKTQLLSRNDRNCFFAKLILFYHTFMTLRYREPNKEWHLTISLLGYLKTRIRWGGGQFDSPSKSHVLCPNMTNDTSLESSCALLLESAKKFANLQKLNFLSQNPVI